MTGRPSLSARDGFGFSAVVGHDDLKLALLLAAIDPAIGGVLLRGDKGSGKTTLARGLAALLGVGAPFVELPLGATEDRVLGSIDLGAALTTGTEKVRRGLLADADGGVLYVDEVNLLADHLVDTLLDVAVSGRLLLERDGISVVQPARFVLVGTMNPEEGELRPQLLDRFGLCVAVDTSTDPDTRAEIVRRRLAFDRSPGPDAADAAFRDRLARTTPAVLDDDTILFASRLAVAAGAEGVRADIVLCRAAAALAGWEGRDATGPDDVERVAPFVLAHRRRRSPFESPGLAPDDLERALAEARTPPSEPPPGPTADRPVELGPERRTPDPLPPSRQGTPAGGSPGRRDPTPGPRGRMVRDQAFDAEAGGGIAVTATVRNLAGRRTVDPDAAPERSDLRTGVHEDRTGSLVVVALDTSGSMGARERVRAATGAVLGVLTQAYQRRDRVAMVTFAGDGARVVLAPTSSVEVARKRLADLETGGTTPLAAGITAAVELAVAHCHLERGQRRAVLVVVTDGRATVGDDPGAEALAAAQTVRAAGLRGLVLDAEHGTPRLGLAQRLADAMDAPCRPLGDLTAATLQQLANAQATLLGDRP